MSFADQLKQKQDAKAKKAAEMESKGLDPTAGLLNLEKSPVGEAPPAVDSFQAQLAARLKNRSSKPPVAIAEKDRKPTEQEPPNFQDQLKIRLKSPSSTIC
jgi:hypothetical protein